MKNMTHKWKQSGFFLQNQEAFYRLSKKCRRDTRLTPPASCAPGLPFQNLIFAGLETSSNSAIKTLEQCV